MAPVIVLDPMLISEDEFVDYTSAWQKRFYTDNPNSGYFNPIFSRYGQPLHCVLFSRDAILSLLSTTGITTVKVKFCIKDYITDANGAKQTEEIFTLALFGTTANGVVKSAYYVGTPSPIIFSGGGSGGNIPDQVAKKWINNWENAYDNGKGLISTAFFNTMYGPLKGYTYDMYDFLDSLYKNTKSDDDLLCFHFAIHEHYMPGETDIRNLTRTFNTVLQGVHADGTSSHDLFYDISSPCPPTC